MALVLRTEPDAATPIAPPTGAQNLPTGVVTSVTFANRLLSHVITAWNYARNVRSEVTTEIITARQERKFKYDPTTLAALHKEGASDLFIGLADYKCRLLQAFLKDLLIGQGEKPWGVTPTPEPELPVDYEPLIQEAIQEARSLFFNATGEPPPDAMIADYRQTLEQQLLEELRDEAKKGAERMEDAIEDAFVEGKFYDALVDCLDDLVTCPSMVLKGPIVKQKPKLKWVQNNDGRWTFEVQNKLITEYQRVDPLLIYPAENSKGPNDRYLCEITRLTRRALEQMRGTPGVSEQAVELILQQHAMSGLSNWLGFTHYVESETSLEWQHPDATFDMLTYWGDIDGSMLLEWANQTGETLNNIEADKVYSACIYVIGNYVLKARLNYHPLDHRPYYVTSFDKSPQHFWGRSLCEIIRPIARMANANVRALANNMGLASGPQVEVNMDRVSQGQNVDTLYPWKKWLVKNDRHNNTAPAVRFFQPDDRSGSLIQVFQFWSERADEFLGLNALIAGSSNVGTVGRTASGLSMLLNNANKFVKQVILNVDLDVVEPAVAAQYLHIMQYHQNNSIKIDVVPHARGAVALAIKDALQLRRQEFLGLTNNPVDLQIMGVDGRANLLRQVAATLDMDVDQLVAMPNVRSLVDRLSDAPAPEQLLAAQAGPGSPALGVGQGAGLNAGLAGPESGLAGTPGPAPGAIGSNEVIPGTQSPTTDFFSPTPGQLT